MLNENGIKAAALNGAQAGFVTNDDFTNAKIIEMNCDRIHEELENVDVIVVTGFQGQTKKVIRQHLDAEVVILQLQH